MTKLLEILKLCTIAAFSCDLLWAAHALAQNAQSHQASQTDCAVLGALVKGGYGGGPMFAESFGADCDWASMGIDMKVESRPPGQFYEGVKLFYSQPIYSDNGLTANVTRTIGGQRSVASYFYSLTYCTAKKIDEKWVLAECHPGPIT